jgi:hypothetical protein
MQTELKQLRADNAQLKNKGGSSLKSERSIQGNHNAIELGQRLAEFNRRAQSPI